MSRPDRAVEPPPSLAAIVEGVYAALNRNDIPAFLDPFDPEVERIEPEGFPASGTIRGLAALRDVLVEQRGKWAEGGCFPERLANAGPDRVLAIVNVGVRIAGEATWREGRIADAFAFRAGKIVFFRTFVDVAEAMRWAGVDTASHP